MSCHSLPTRIFFKSLPKHSKRQVVSEFEVLTYKNVKVAFMVDLFRNLISKTIFEKLILRIFEEKYLNWIFCKGIRRKI